MAYSESLEQLYNLLPETGLVVILGNQYVNHKWLAATFFERKEMRMYNINRLKTASPEEITQFIYDVDSANNLCLCLGWGHKEDWNETLWQASSGLWFTQGNETNAIGVLVLKGPIDSNIDSNKPLMVRYWDLINRDIPEVMEPIVEEFKSGGFWSIDRATDWMNRCTARFEQIDNSGVCPKCYRPKDLWHRFTCHITRCWR